jgi:hypothetical protein
VRVSHVYAVHMVVSQEAQHLRKQNDMSLECAWVQLTGQHQPAGRVIPLDCKNCRHCSHGCF